jgi:hypothetical protein
MIAKKAVVPVAKANGNKADITKALSEEETKLLNRCRLEIQRGFVQIGRALMLIRDKRLYRETHSSFEAFCQEEFQMARTFVHYHIEAVKVMDNLLRDKGSQIVNVPTSEGVTRELTKVKDPEEQKEVWKEAVKTSPKGKKVTASHLRETINKKMAEKTGVKPKSKPNKTSSGKFKETEAERKAYAEKIRHSKDPRHEILNVVWKVSAGLPKLFTEGKFATDLDIVIKCRDIIIPSVLKGIVSEFEEEMLKQKAKLLGTPERPTKQGKVIDV